MDEKTRESTDSNIKAAKRETRRLVVVLLAAVLMAFNIKSFVHTGGLFPGGATGLALLIQRGFLKYAGVNLPYSPINVLINSIPVYIGFRFIGKRFTLFSLVMIVVSSVLADVMPAITITQDVLLISIFGGILNGTAISMCLSVDATSGGTDFISIYLSQRRGMDSFNIILGINVVILAMAGVMFGWDKALYSIIFQYASTQILHLLYRSYQQMTLFIVTDKPDEICHVIYDVSRHGATILDAKGSYRHDNKPVVYSVIDVPDTRKVIKGIRDKDPHVFIDCVRTSELKGNFYFSPKD